MRDINDVVAPEEHRDVGTVGRMYQKLYDVVRRLRAPDGCPWDRKQTPQSLRGSLLEEAYECVEAIDADDAEHTAEELADVQLVVTMIAVIEEETGRSSVAEALGAVVDKLTRRHPHVFGDSERMDDPDAVVDEWNRIKIEEENRRPKDRLLDAVSTALPPLERAYKLQKKAAKVGFDWPDRTGVTAKLHEELDELDRAVRVGSDEEREAEIGDVLFSAINLARFIGVDPALALRRANEKFTHRFAHVEARMNDSGVSMAAEHIEQMEAYWQEAKQGVQTPGD